MLAETIAGETPDVKYATALAPSAWFQKFTLSIGDKNVKAIGQYAGKDYFNIFSFPLIAGDKDHALADKNSIVTTTFFTRKTSIPHDKLCALCKNC
jgi:putative ABC transport system permease protein